MYIKAFQTLETDRINTEGQKGGILYSSKVLYAQVNDIEYPHIFLDIIEDMDNYFLSKIREIREKRNANKPQG